MITYLYRKRGEMIEQTISWCCSETFSHLRCQLLSESPSRGVSSALLGGMRYKSLMPTRTTPARSCHPQIIQVYMLWISVNLMTQFEVVQCHSDIINNLIYCSPWSRCSRIAIWVLNAHVQTYRLRMQRAVIPRFTKFTKQATLWISLAHSKHLPVLWQQVFFQGISGLLILRPNRLMSFPTLIHREFCFFVPCANCELCFLYKIDVYIYFNICIYIYMYMFRVY